MKIVITWRNVCKDFWTNTIPASYMFYHLFQKIYFFYTSVNGCHTKLKKSPKSSCFRIFCHFFLGNVRWNFKRYVHYNEQHHLFHILYYKLHSYCVFSQKTFIKVTLESFLLLRNIQEVHTKGFQECPIKKTKSITLQWFLDEEHLSIKIQFRKCGQFLFTFYSRYISTGSNFLDSFYLWRRKSSWKPSYLL